MKPKIFFIFIGMVFFWGLTMNSALAYEATQGPTGVLQWDREKTDFSFTLYDAGNKTYLLSPAGDLYYEREWEVGGNTELLENGHWLRHEPAEGGSIPDLRWGGESGKVSEYDGDGNLIWTFPINDEDQISHHWITRTSRGTTLVMVWERIPYADAVAAGRDPATLSDSAAGNCYASQNPPGRYKCDLWPDAILELNSSDPANVYVEWEWHAWDHIGTGPLEIDINYRFPITKDSHRASADFMHSNRVDFQPDSADPDQGRIILSSRVFGEFFEIEYPSGAIINRWGNPTTYGSTDLPEYMSNGEVELFGQHAAHYIKPGYPGEGNVLLYDNGWMRPTGGNGRVVEVNPDTGAIEWEFTPNSNTFTPFVGDVRRLANGNTMMVVSMQGHVIEVTPEKEIVWEFISPIFAGEHLCFAKDTDTNGPFFANFFSVARRYSPSYPGFQGKQITYQVWSDECPSNPYLIYNSYYGGN
jgi:hypothetical protein